MHPGKIIPAFLVLLCYCSEQLYGQITFEKVFGDTVYRIDPGDLRQSFDSGLVVTGSVYNLAQPSPGYLFKTDANGNLLWKNQYSVNDHFLFPIGLEQAEDSGFIITGMAVDSNYYIDPYNARFRTLLIKTDAQGNLLWGKMYRTVTDSLSRGFFYYTSAVKETSTGNFIIAGHVCDSALETRAFLLATDNMGNVLWSKTYHLSGRYSMSNDILLDAADNITLLGSDYSYAAGDTTVFIIRTNSNGVPQWSRSISTIALDSLVPCADFYAHLENAANGFVFSGPIRHVGNPSWYGDIHHPYMMKMDDNGNLLWNKIYSPCNVDERIGYSIRKLNPSQGAGYILSGTSENIVPDADLMYLIRTDTSGNITWNRTFGTNTDEEEVAWYALPTYNNGFALLSELSIPTAHFPFGETFLLKTDSMGHLPCQEMNMPVTVSTSTFINTPVTLVVDSGIFTDAGLSFIQTDPVITAYTVCSSSAVPSITQPGRIFTIYPDPFSAQATLHCDAALKNATLTIYNSTGQLQLEMKDVNGNDVMLLRHALPPGLYFVRLMENGNAAGTMKFVITD